MGNLVRRRRYSGSFKEPTPAQNWLRFKALSAGTFSLYIPKGAQVKGTYNTRYMKGVDYVEYSMDYGTTWTKTTLNGSADVTITTPTVQAGRSVLWRGDANTYCYSSNYSRFSSTVDYEAHGDIRSLLKPEDFEVFTNMSFRSYAFASLFMQNNITTIPEIGFTTISEYAFQRTFYNCSKLTKVTLPNITLANNCYAQMFYACYGLVEAVLPSTALKNYCYDYMFVNCTKLCKVKAMFITTPNDNYTRNWLLNVPTSGVFIKNTSATWNVTGVNGIPSGWIVQTASS